MLAAVADMNLAAFPPGHLATVTCYGRFAAPLQRFRAPLQRFRPLQRFGHMLLRAIQRRDGLDMAASALPGKSSVRMEEGGSQGGRAPLVVMQH